MLLGSRHGRRLQPRAKPLALAAGLAGLYIVILDDGVHLGQQHRSEERSELGSEASEWSEQHSTAFLDVLPAKLGQETPMPPLQRSTTLCGRGMAMPGVRSLALEGQGRASRIGRAYGGGRGPFGGMPGGMRGGMPGGMPGGFPGGRPGGMPGGFNDGGGPGFDPFLIFLGLLVLSWIPGPWQLITQPLLSIFNLYYLFKFGLVFLLFGGLAATAWWIGFTTTESQCPNCGLPQRASKSEPFQCLQCGSTLQANKDGEFEMYIKSGQAPRSPFEEFTTRVQDTASSFVDATPSGTSGSTSSSSEDRSGGGSKKRPGKPRSSKPEVIDAEVL